MYLLKDNKLVYIDTKEDSIKDITIVVTIAQLNKHWEDLGIKNTTEYVADKIYQMHCERYKDDFGYIFRVVQSEYADKSNLNNGLGMHNTLGDAIKAASSKGHIVLRNGQPLLQD